MKSDLILKVSVPKEVKLSIVDDVLTAKGPKGENSRRFRSDRITFSIEESSCTVTCLGATKRDKTQFYTAVSHLKNLLQGVNEGFTYTLKVCSGHFPMTVAVKADILEVKNFIGESVPRRLKLSPHVKVTTDGSLVTVEGIDIEHTGNQAAQIELLTRRVGFDRRIFQDGIYITEKPQ